MSNNTVSDSSRNTKIKKGIIAIVSAVLICVLGEFAAYYLMDLGLDGNWVLFVFRAVASTIAFILLGGKKWLNFKNNSIGKTLKFCIALLSLNIVLAIMYAAYSVSQGIVEGAAVRILSTVLLALLIGINEEFIFRGLLYQGILVVGGKKKNSLMTAAIISSILFGFIHVIGSLDFSNIYVTLTALLKTVETAMFGFILCYCCTFYKDIIGAIVFHSLFDWVILAAQKLSETELQLEYTSADQESGITKIISFSIMILIYLPATIKAVKRIRAAELTDGIFGDGGDEVTEPVPTKKKEKKNKKEKDNKDEKN